MLKKTIVFTDYNGNEITEDFYFNLSKAELAEMELEMKGGLAAHLEAIIASEDGKAIIDTFKGLVRRAYGKKSEDGRRFQKSEDLWLEFLESSAYDILFMELVTDAQASAEFINGVIPEDLRNASGQAQLPFTKAVEDVELPEDSRPAWLREGRDPTQVELMNMPQSEMLLAFKHKNRQ